MKNNDDIVGANGNGMLTNRISKIRKSNRRCTASIEGQLDYLKDVCIDFILPWHDFQSWDGARAIEIGWVYTWCYRQLIQRVKLQKVFNKADKLLINVAAREDLGYLESHRHTDIGYEEIYNRPQHPRTASVMLVCCNATNPSMPQIVYSAQFPREEISTRTDLIILSTSNLPSRLIVSSFVVGKNGEGFKLTLCNPSWCDPKVGNGIGGDGSERKRRLSFRERRRGRRVEQESTLQYSMAKSASGEEGRWKSAKGA